MPVVAKNGREHAKRSARKQLTSVASSSMGIARGLAALLSSLSLAVVIRVTTDIHLGQILIYFG